MQLRCTSIARDAKGAPSQQQLANSPEGSTSLSKGAISQLQEFVQGAKLFPMPPNCPVLQWDYDTRMVSMCLEFRATVAFLLDGVPHHVAGAWKHSKKLAQRDTAERTLALFVNRWGELVQDDVRQGEQPQGDTPGGVVLQKNMSRGSSTTTCGESSPPPPPSEVAALEDFSARFSSLCPSACLPPPRWSHTTEGGQCRAFVEVSMFDVPHTFPGKPCATREAAEADAAKRALWYLQCPGYEEAFEPDPEFVKAAAQTIPDISTLWARDKTDEGEEQLLAERKTVVMRIQNRLQQAYARQLEAGTSVWYWSYDRHPRDKGWPPLFRATVHVPLANQTFTGTWVRGQRESQIDACTHIAEFLNELAPKTKGA